MAGEIRAVIDVGTNSVKLLVASVDGTEVHPLEEKSDQTRLGRGFYETHSLQAAAIRETARAAGEFVSKARAWKAERVQVIGTSAARDAINKEDLLEAIRGATGLEMRVLSGAEEADWAFRGVITDRSIQNDALLVIDVGGGSTEFTLGTKGKRIMGESFKLGTVRFLERTPLGDPPRTEQLTACEQEAREILETEVKPALQASLDQLGKPVQLIGTGGTNTILARISLKLDRFDRGLIEGAVLTREEIRGQKEALWRVPLEARRTTPGLPPNRADVILPGVVFVGEIMAAFRLADVRISTRGLRFGALMDETAGFHAD